MDFQEYQSIIVDDIESCLEGMGVQPILFFGSGMSQRYIDTPTWNGLLEILANQCPNIDKNIAYYQQKHNSPIAISSEFAEYIREWAWNEEDLFPSDLFEPNKPADIYIKHIVSEIFRGIDSSPEAESKLTLYSKCAFRFVRPAVPVSSGHLYRLHPARLILPLPNLLFT